MKINIGKTTLIFTFPIKIRRPREDGRDDRRGFTHTQQVQVWHLQSGKCGNGEIGCGVDLDLRTVVYHHILPWYRGGKTVIGNCIALCPNCHQITVYEDSLQNAEASREK